MHVSMCLRASVSRTCGNISNVQKLHELYLSFYGHIFDTVDTLTSTCSPEPNCEVPPSQSAQEAEDEAWRDVSPSHCEGDSCHFVGGCCKLHSVLK